MNLDLPGGKFFMPLFVKLKGDQKLDEDGGITHPRRRSATSTHRGTCRTGSSRCRPIPYTLTGKKMEVPVRRILMGVPVEKAANRAAMANVEALDFFIDYSRTQSDYRLAT